MMDGPAYTPRESAVAVRLSQNTTHSTQLDQFLGSRSWSNARRFLPKDDDELNDRLCRGEFEAVVFAHPEDALEMIWSGHGSVGLWNGGARAVPFDMHFAIKAGCTDAEWSERLRLVQQSYAAWEVERRRRQTIAGCILTAVALAAMGLLLWARG